MTPSGVECRVQVYCSISENMCIVFPNTGNQRELGKHAAPVWNLVEVRARLQMYVHKEMGNAKQMPNKKASTIGPSVWGERGVLQTANICGNNSTWLRRVSRTSVG